ncbi:MAG: hypothetical protein P8124_11305 [Gammaproteobacteria bacterium]
MATRIRIGLVALLLTATAAGLSGCAAYYGPPAYAHSPYYYDYYYYPHAHVYFQIYSGEYYYRSGGTWRRSRTLPKNIYLDRRDRVPMHIPGKTPYTHNTQRPQARPAPSPHYQRTPQRNRQERQNNQRHHEEYRQRYGR